MMIVLKLSPRENMVGFCFGESWLSKHPSFNWEQGQAQKAKAQVPSTAGSLEVWPLCAAACTAWTSCPGWICRYCRVRQERYKNW